jgi:hypothetical protein
LWGRGLSAYEAHRVTGSVWLEEHVSWNSVHPNHSTYGWEAINHYLLAFHDDMVEALARGIEAKFTRGTMSSLLEQCVHTLIHEPHRR